MACVRCGDTGEKKIEFCRSCWSMRDIGGDSFETGWVLPYYTTEVYNLQRVTKSRHTVEVMFQIGDLFRSIVCNVTGSVSGFEIMFAAVDEACYILMEENAGEEEVEFFRHTGESVFINLVEEQINQLESHVVSCRFLFFSELSLL